MRPRSRHDGQPGCLYVLSKFQGLFEELFNAYCYEEKMAVREDENGKIRQEAVRHMPGPQEQCT